MGIATDIRLLQLENIEDPMFVTLSGIVILVNPQLENALSPIVVTLSGITTLERLLQPENVEDLMVVTPLGIITLAGHVPFIAYATLPSTIRPSG